ncbi:MAG: hypothetical protein ACHQ2Z_13045 [Elusimicrobiota bacterium]
MSVYLTPLSARSYSVGAANDPYKKYWWAILAGFIVTGAWLCIPIMETPVGSARADAPAKPAIDAAGAEQGLDSAANPNGAPGGALDLSMDGAKHKTKDGSVDDMASMLYQAAPEAGAAAGGKPLGDATAASAATLAQQLKDAGKKPDDSGWAEKAQRGFDAPHLAGGALSGLGSAHGGSSSSAGGGVGAFGSRNADVGFGSTRGLHDDGSDSPGFQALRAAAGRAAAPNLKGSDEAMHAGMSQAFDGGKGKAGTAIGMSAMAQANAALNAAPANLKTKINAKLDTKKLPDPVGAPTPAAAANNMGKELAMMAATALIGGMIPGVGGQMVMMMGMAMMQQQSAASTTASQQKQAALQNKANQ